MMKKWGINPHFLILPTNRDMRERVDIVEAEDELLLDKVKDKKTINPEQDSLQYNSQDLDQEQNVEVRPIQRNTQNLHIHVSNDRDDYSGKITGTTYMESTREILKNVEIELYFGTDAKSPVYKTISDSSGNYSIEDLPPGFYTIVAKCGDIYWHRSPFIKVLPCRNANEPLFLKVSR